jgi:hypothetical protein
VKHGLMKSTFCGQRMLTHLFHHYFLTVLSLGETFTAYLGALNVSKDLPVRHLTVSAQLQTPSQRYRIPSKLDA